MTDYAWGVLTPFAAIAALALAVGAGYLLFALARHIWGKAHYSLLMKVDVASNPPRVYKLAPGEEADSVPEYWHAANKFRDALLEVPRMYSVAGLGWRIVLVRESRTEKETP